MSSDPTIRDGGLSPAGPGKPSGRPMARSAKLGEMVPQCHRSGEPGRERDLLHLRIADLEHRQRHLLTPLLCVRRNSGRWRHVHRTEGLRRRNPSDPGGYCWQWPCIRSASLTHAYLVVTIPPMRPNSVDHTIRPNSSPTVRRPHSVHHSSSNTVPTSSQNWPPSLEFAMLLYHLLARPYCF